MYYIVNLGPRKSVVLNALKEKGTETERNNSEQYSLLMENFKKLDVVITDLLNPSLFSSWVSFSFRSLLFSSVVQNTCLKNTI